MKFAAPLSYIVAKRITKAASKKYFLDTIIRFKIDDKDMG